MALYLPSRKTLNLANCFRKEASLNRGLTAWFLGHVNAPAGKTVPNLVDHTGTWDATLSSGTKFANISRTGGFGRGWYTTGGEKIIVPNGANIAAGDFTVAFSLFRRNNVGSFDSIVTKAVGGNREFCVYASDGNIALAATGGGNSTPSGFPFTRKIWFHYVQTRIGTTLKHFFNGIELDSRTVSNTTGQSAQMWFGAEVGSGGNNTDQIIDDIRIYVGRGLIANEVNNLFVAWSKGYVNELNFGRISFSLPPNAVNATGTASSPGTITLTAPTATATGGGTGEGSSPGTITLSAPTGIAYQNTDATGTASSPGTITLTAPTSQALASSTATATSPGTITLTAPTATAFEKAGVEAVGTITFTAPTADAYQPVEPGPVGTVVLTAPSARALPDYVYAPTPTWLGQYRRGKFLPLVIGFPELPDAAPTVTIYQGVTFLETIRLPVIDQVNRVFGFEHFLGEAYTDGHYIVFVDWTTDGNAQFTVDYFNVLGGTGRAAIATVAEFIRPLGRAIVSIDEEGLARIAYNPRRPS